MNEAPSPLNHRRKPFDDLVMHRPSLRQGKTTQPPKNLKFWLLGLAEKTAQNLELGSEDLAAFLAEQVAACEGLLRQFGSSSSEAADAWSYTVAGAATLALRGKSKSMLGKAIEKSFLIACYSLLGLKLGEDFAVLIYGDKEVSRQVDAEIYGPRRTYFVDLGLIGKGNPEVLYDKAARLKDLGVGNVLIFDLVHAGGHQKIQTSWPDVTPIQIRNSQPLFAMRDHLASVQQKHDGEQTRLLNLPTLEGAVREAVFNLPDSLFE